MTDRTIDFDDPSEKAAHDKLVSLVDSMLDLHNLNNKTQKGAASSAPTLGDLVRVFKSMSAINVNRIVCRPGGPVWQRNYYEHIIRSEDDMNKIREYIETNPARWYEDE